MRNTFILLYETDMDFKDFIEDFEKTANFYIATSDNNKDAVLLCMAYAYIAGVNKFVGKTQSFFKEGKEDKE